MSDNKPLLDGIASIPTDPPPEYSPDEHAATSTSTLPVRPAAQQAPPTQPVRRAPPPFETPLLTHLRTRRVVLASASPRRKQLLAQVGLPNLEIWPSDKPEDLPKTAYGPFEYVSATAYNKCIDVYREILKQQEEAEADAAKHGRPGGVPADPALVIAADTVIVTRAGKVLEKPRSAADHVHMLKHLRDTQTHRVLTAVCTLAPRADAKHPGYHMAAHTEETTVTFAQAADGLTDDAIESYVRTREGADKAGGYALQGLGGLVLVEKIEGSMDNVIGLPVRQCLKLAEEVVFHADDDDFDADGSAEE